MSRPLIPIGEYGTPASGVDPSPSDAYEPGFTPDEAGGAASPPPSFTPAEPPAASGSPEDAVNLTKGVAYYRGMLTPLTDEDKQQISAICVRAIERQFKSILEGLRNELPDEGR